MPSAIFAPELAARATVTVADIPNLDAAPAYAALRSEGGKPIIVLPSGHEAVHLSSYDDVFSVVNDASFARAVCNTDDGPSFIPTTTPGEFLLNLDGLEHTRSRRVINRTFGTRLLESLRPLAKRATDEALADMLSGRTPPDLFLSVLDRVPSRVVCELLGIDTEERAYFRPLSHYVQRASADDVPELLRQFGLLYDYMAVIVRRARAGQGSAFMQEFLQVGASAEPPLTDAEVIGLTLPLLLGGDQNVLSVMSKIAYSLLCAPALYAWLVHDPACIPAAIEELIRLIPLGTLSLFPRVATRPFQSSYGVLEPGTVVYADAFRANRDPVAFPAPETIDFSRTGKKHLQFGYGMHHCMGAALARLEIGIVLSQLVERLPALRLEAAPQTLKWAVGTVLRRPESLPVAWS